MCPFNCYFFLLFGAVEYSDPQPRHIVWHPPAKRHVIFAMFSSSDSGSGTFWSRALTGKECPHQHVLVLMSLQVLRTCLVRSLSCPCFGSGSNNKTKPWPVTWFPLLDVPQLKIPLRGRAMGAQVLENNNNVSDDGPRGLFGSIEGHDASKLLAGRSPSQFGRTAVTAGRNKRRHVRWRSGKRC